MLSTHNQYEWDKFLDSLNFKDGPLYKIYKQLLHKRPATPPLSGSNGLVFPAKEKAKLMEDSLVLQFTLNPGPHLPVISNTHTDLDSKSLSSTMLTIAGMIEYLILGLPKKKALSED